MGGVTGTNLSRLISNHVRQHGLGVVYSADTGFLLGQGPDTVRAGDVAFVGSARISEDESGFFPGAPDLVVEVVSPSDRVREVEDKTRAWVDAGARAVWVVWPNTRTVAIHGPGAKPVTLTEDDALDGGDVLPGFRCPVAEVFV